MKEIIVDKNIAGQRLDRFVRKYLDLATMGFIYRMIRKKNIVINDKRAKENQILEKGDSIKLYLADDTIRKFRSEDDINIVDIKLDIVYEDTNVIIINKPAGLLSHSSTEGDKNLVDGMINYLIEKGHYIPEENPTFTPSICNRLERNTSGIVVGVKTYEALRELNRGFRNSTIDRYYTAIVDGVTSDKERLVDMWSQDQGQVTIGPTGDKKVVTEYQKLSDNGRYSLVDINLVTGRTHQIRSHFKYIGHPIVGDPRYGDRRINQSFRDRYGLEHQLLHCGKIVFDGIEGSVSYLNGREFSSDYPRIFKRVLKEENL